MKGDCPQCGARNTMVAIPKHRNGHQGRICGICNHIVYTTWEDIEDQRMGYKDFTGIKNGL